jgi:hypothetical protein
MLLSPSPLRCMAKSSFTALGHSSEEDPVTTQTVGGVSGGQLAYGKPRPLSSF